MIEDHFRLQWYRDLGNGQVASDAVHAHESMIGTWPVAIWVCENKEEATERWWRLLQEYQINAMTYYPNRERQQKLDALSLRYLKAIDDQDFDELERIWLEVTNDQGAEQMLHELNEELAKEQ